MAASPGMAAAASGSGLGLSREEIERCCALEVNDLWVGSLWGGAYRLGAWRRSPLAMLLTELLVLATLGVFSLPVGLGVVRLLGLSGSAQAAALPFSAAVAGTTLALSALRYAYLSHHRRRWRSLLHILEEVDRFQETLQAIELLDQLGGLQGDRPAPAADGATIQALSLTRDSLVTGLLADQLLRQQRQRRGALARCIDLVEHLDQNLATLHAAEAQQQAVQSAVLLRDALQIGIAVRQSLDMPQAWLK